jgi:hypothetical protein
MSEAEPFLLISVPAVPCPDYKLEKGIAQGNE